VALLGRAPRGIVDERPDATKGLSEARVPVDGKRQHRTEKGGYEQERSGRTVGNQERAQKSSGRAEKDEAGGAKPPQTDTSTAVVAAQIAATPRTRRHAADTLEPEQPDRRAGRRASLMSSPGR
jgi:hypothetical protein